MYQQKPKYNQQELNLPICIIYQYRNIVKKLPLQSADLHSSLKSVIYTFYALQEQMKIIVSLLSYGIEQKKSILD